MVADVQTPFGPHLRNWDWTHQLPLDPSQDAWLRMSGAVGTVCMILTTAPWWWGISLDRWLQLCCVFVVLFFLLYLPIIADHAWCM